MPRTTLVLLSSILNWVSGILPHVSDLNNRINRAIPMADLLLPMHRLANENFVGRKNELATMAQYVGIIPAQNSAIQAASRFFTELFVSIDKNPPFLIYGPGGVGKSTLVANSFLIMLLM
jgi:hypothetical protein